MDIFSKKKIIFKLCLHLFNYYILCHIFFKKLKSFFKKKFQPIFLPRKIRPQNGHFFRKKIKI